MEHFDFMPTLRLIQTSIKIIASTQRLMLAQLEQQTRLLQQVGENIPADTKAPFRKSAVICKPKPIVLNSAEVALLLGLHKNYGYKKMVSIKKKLHLPPDVALSVRDFCRATGLALKDVYNGLGY